MNPLIEVLCRVATSATCSIDRAHHHARGIDVAVKRSIGRGAATLAWEAEVLAQVSHEGIPPIIEFGEDGDGPFLLRGWVEGVSIDQRIAEQVLTEASCRSLMRALLSSLAAVHAAGFAHADVSTTNVLLCADGGFALIDFGNATRLDASAKHLMGSVYHMAPELFDHAPPSVRSDLYAVGVLAYTALTGVFPFDGENATQVIVAHHRMRPMPISDRCAVSAGFEHWVKRMLSRRPEDRPLNVTTALEELMLA